MPSRNGIQFTAAYHNQGGEPRDGAATEKRGPVDTPQSLLRWAQAKCPAGKELSVITCAGGNLSNAIWWKDSGFDQAIVRRVFS